MKGRTFTGVRALDGDDLFLYGQVGSDITARDLAEKLIGREDVVIHVYSGGGDLFEAGVLYSLLKQHKGEVVVRIEGLAASATAYFVMAADRIEIDKNAQFMIHNAWTIAAGDHNDLKSMAEQIKRWQKGMVDAFVERTGIGEEKMENMMDEETWMTAAEAVEMGFADSIFESEQEVAAEISMEEAEKLGYKRIPDVLKGMSKKSEPINNNHKGTEPNTMDDRILKALNISDSDAGVDRVAQEIQSLQEKANKVPNLESQLSDKKELVGDLNSKVTSYEKELKELRAKVEDSEVDDLVTKALDEAGVKASDEVRKALKRRAESYYQVDEKEEQVRADLWEDMVLYAETKGIKEGVDDNLSSSNGSVPKSPSPVSKSDGEDGGGLSYEKRLEKEVNAKLKSDPSMAYGEAVEAAKRELQTAQS